MTAADTASGTAPTTTPTVTPTITPTTTPMTTPTVTPTITPIIMPKWGLEMREGTVVDWLVEEGTRITVGMPILDVETDKISNTVEAPDPGLLRRRLAHAGETLAVRALLGVLADPEVSEEAIDAFVKAFVVPLAGTAEESSGPSFESATIDGIRVRYAQRGPDAEVPLVLLHGFGGDLGNWLFNIDALAEHVRVLALDLPGHGQSTAQLPGASLEAMSGFVAGWLDAIGVARAHFAGHSMGAAIASQLALDAPGRVASLALLCPAGLGEAINTSYTEGFAAAESRRELKPVVEQLFHNPELVTRSLLEDLLKYKRIDGVQELLRDLGGALFHNGKQRATPGLRLSDPALPVLVIWGESDRIIPASQAANAPPHAQVEVLKSAGHMVMLEKATEVNALLRKHLGL